MVRKLLIHSHKELRLELLKGLFRLGIHPVNFGVHKGIRV